MKIIFLDLDGVMNGFEYWPADVGRRYIDLKAVSRLNNITKKTGAKLVITSTWRKYCDVKEILKDAGVEADIIGATPFLDNRSRGDEILQWLNTSPLVEKFIILDDDSDMGNLVDFLIKTDWGRGLEEQHMEEAIYRLS